MVESKHDCRIQIFAPVNREIGWVTGCTIHLFTHQVDELIFWFGQIEVPTAIEDVAEACEHFQSNSLKFGITTATHGAFAAPLGFEVNTIDEVRQAVLSVSGTSRWMPLEVEP